MSAANPDCRIRPGSRSPPTPPPFDALVWNRVSGQCADPDNHPRITRNSIWDPGYIDREKRPDRSTDDPASCLLRYIGVTPPIAGFAQVARRRSSDSFDRR